MLNGHLDTFKIIDPWLHGPRTKLVLQEQVKEIPKVQLEQFQGYLLPKCQLIF